mgnify:CR=1 FL=1
MEKGIIETLQPTAVSIGFVDGLIILLFSVLAGLFAKYIFQRYSNSFSSKSSFGNTILLVTISVASLISVIKSSLALSLGLVGALSVVRFRTAVKEPYNLSFILWAICLGIAIGASQFIFSLLIAIVGAFSIVVAYKGFTNKKPSNYQENELDTLSVSFKGDSGPNELYEILDSFSVSYLIKTINQSEEGIITATLGVDIADQKTLTLIMNQITNSLLDSNITFYNSPIL